MNRVGRRALAAMPALLLLLAPAGASAQEEPGSGLVAYRLLANAPGFSLNGLYRDVDVTVPEVTSSLSTGAVGAGLSSLAWPGPVIGNGGSTLLVLAPQAPPEAVLLNSPVRAETRTGGQRQATNATVPGALMTSRAEPAEVTAAASTGDTVLPVVTVGSLDASSRVALTGARTAVAEARSTIGRISLLEGVVQIGAVTSEVTAASDGVTATSEGATTVIGMTVAGVTVTVDDTGLHVDGTDVPNPLPLEAVNEAVAATGLQVLLTAPRTTTSGGTVSHDAGALVLLFTQDGAQYSLTLGRASVDVLASPGDPLASTPDIQPAPSAPAPAPIEPVTTGPLSDVPVNLPSGAVPVLAAPATSGTVQAPATAPSALTPTSFVLSGGVPGALAVLGLMAVGLLATGLHRWPDRLLTLPTVDCEQRSS